MVKVKGNTKGTPLDALEAASDSKQSDSVKRSSPEVEESPAPASAQLTAASPPLTSINTEAVALPFAKRARLQEQLQRVERQILDLETGLIGTSDAEYSVFKGYNALLPGSKRKSPDAMPLHIFSDSSVHNM